MNFLTNLKTKFKLKQDSNIDNKNKPNKYTNKIKKDLRVNKTIDLKI